MIYKLSIKGGEAKVLKPKSKKYAKAIIREWADGRIEYYDEFGNLHNLKGPAFNTFGGDPLWYIHGVMYESEKKWKEIKENLWYLK